MNWDQKSENVLSKKTRFMPIAVFRVTRILKTNFGAIVKDGDTYSPIGDFIRTLNIGKKEIMIGCDSDSTDELDVIFEIDESPDFIQKISASLSKIKPWI